eukprot:6177195-Pleurochrysis_carterae.AAC.5
MAAAAPPPHLLIWYHSTFIRYCRACTMAFTNATANVANGVCSYYLFGKLLRRGLYFGGSDESDVVEDAMPRSKGEGVEPRKPRYGEYMPTRRHLPRA